MEPKETLKVGRPLSSEFAPHAKAYVDLVKGDNILLSLAEDNLQTMALLKPLTEEQALFSYAPGKWSIKEIIGHLSDTERIHTYRMLRIARHDTTPLPGFEQDDYVQNAGSNGRPLRDLLEEFKLVRQSTLALLRSFPPEAWARSGRVSDWTLTVRGMAFTSAGHELHHVRILREQYLPSLH